MQQPVLVLGAGSWGTALALVLARNGQTVLLWSWEASHVQQMQANRQNAQFLPHFPFPPSLQPIATLPDAVSQVKEIIAVVPSHAFRETLLKIAPNITDSARICWATKGLEYQSGLLLHQVAEQIFGQKRPLAVLAGPSFAVEVAKDLPTAVTIASHFPDYLKEIVNLFHNRNFRPYTSDDVIGVQLGSAIKNVIAIAAGIADGLGLGANTRAALVTRGLTEMVRLGTLLGGKPETFMGLTGLGDLMLTCTDNQSRNRRFGYALAQGNTSQQAQTQIGQVIEGIYTAHEVQRLAHRFEIEMPITEYVCKVLEGHCSPQDAVHALLSRELKQETL